MCGAAPVAGAEQAERLQREGDSQGFQINPSSDDWKMTLPSGIEVALHRGIARRPGVLAEHIREFRPDWVLVSSEDPGHTLLREAGETRGGRVVYLAHTPQFLPFGPESWSPDAHAAARVRNCAAVVVIGQHMAEYVSRHLSPVSPAFVRVAHPPIYGSGPFDSYANFDQGFVLMVNPCAVKGLPIFAAVARAMPEVAFAALPGWGTTDEDRAELHAIPNVTTLEPVRRIEEVLERTRVLMMPSLWYEGFGLIVMEAMLRGIPVVASDSGGLAEAKRGTGFVMPVTPIREYLPTFDEAQMPRPVIAEQPVGRWTDAIRSLVSDRAVYENEAGRSRDAALDFVYGLNAGGLEGLLLELTPGHSDDEGDRSGRLDRLSREQRALLVARLKRLRS